MGNACGGQDSSPLMSCFGEGSATAFDDAWKRYVLMNRYDLEQVGVAPELIDETTNCEVYYHDGSGIVLDLAAVFNNNDNNSTIFKYKDYLEFAALPDTTDFPGLGVDMPQPGYAAGNFFSNNILIPRDWILRNIDTAVSLIPPHPNAYRAFGGKTSGSSSDQL